MDELITLEALRKYARMWNKLDPNEFITNLAEDIITPRRLFLTR